MADPEAARRLAEWEEAREIVRCVGASVSDLRIERVLEYGRAQQKAGQEAFREALEKIAKGWDPIPTARAALSSPSPKEAPTE